jgi:imidazolonepropionase-like amidohydrolase
MSSSQATPTKHRIAADVLIPGRGDPIERAMVCVEGGRITFAGARADAPAGGGDEPVTEAATVMPGLWDCHAHYVGFGAGTLSLDVVATTSPITTSARATADLAATLRGGVTSVRDVGGLGLLLAPAVDEGRIPGPNIHAAGRILSTTGGHGDVHSLNHDFVHLALCNHNFSILCDGVPEVLRAVRLNLRANAKLIKICASGGVMSEIDHPIHQQFSDEEQAAIVAEAGRAERIVAAHCHGKPGIMAALRAGCFTIEHGSYLDEEAADLMVETGAMLVPTRFVGEKLLANEGAIPAYAYEKMKMVFDHHTQAMKIAIAKGVKIAAGCDIFFSGKFYGQNGEEIRNLIEAGMTELQAIEAATANGPDTLGPQAPRSGQLKSGYDADIIAFDTNPLDDRSVWGDPDRLTHVWKAGRLVER